MTEFTGDGLRVTAQDLSAIDPEGGDDDRMFHHDGSSTLSIVGGGSDSTRGYYIWDADSSAWFPLFRNADKIDGKEAGDFLWRDGSLAMEADLDVGNYGIINVGEVSGGTGGVHLNDNHVEVHSHTSGSNVRLLDSNGLLIADGIEGGNFNVPNGALQEGGNRVATRTWTNANADVPNADYADNANNLDGNDASAFLHVSGDQMEGVLDTGQYNIEDGSNVLWDATNTEVPQSSLGGPAASLSAYPLANTDIANSSVTVTAGNQLSGGGTMSLGGSVTVSVDEGSGSGLDADTVDGDQASDLVHVAGDTMSGQLSLKTAAGNDLYISPSDSSDPSIGWNHPSGGILKLRYSKDLHADAEHWLTFSDGNGQSIGDGVAMSYDNSDVLPMQDAQGDLGKSSNRFRNLYLSGTGYIGGDQVATQPWVNTNFYDNTEADNRFLNVSGDSLAGVLDVAANDVDDGTTKIWDTTLGAVPQSSLDGPASSLSAYPLANSDLSNSTVSVAGNSVGLGGSTSVALGDLSNVTASGEGSGGGFDADSVDGAHKSDLDSQYVDASGDTMSGRLTLSGSALIVDKSAGHIQLHESDTATEDFWYFENKNDNFKFAHRDVSASNTTTGLTIDSTENVDVPAGQLSEKGSRVATRTWTNANADVPNADYADSAGDSDTLDGEHASAFADAGHLHDARYILEGGDTMSGVLTLSDGSTAASQSWVNASADVPNADYADSAGDANTLDSLDSSQFLRSDTSDTLNSTLSVSGETQVQFGGSNYHVRYDSGRDVLILGSAENGEVMEVDNAGNLRIEGSLTEGATIGA